MTYESPNTDPRHYAERLVATYDDALQRGIEVAYPDRVGEHPLDVYPEPPKQRAAAPDPGWSAETENKMRPIMGELGYGRTTDRTISELGLKRAHAYIEPGQPHKGKAEIKVVEADENAHPSSWIFGGNPLYEITSEGERASAIRQVGFVPKNQYELGRVLAEQKAGFVPLQSGDEVLPLSYGDKASRFAIGNEPTGQFVRIGTIHGKDAVLLRIDGNKVPKDSGGFRLVDHPEPADVMRILSEACTLQGDSETPVAFVTSATYQASREVAAATAGLSTGRLIGVPTYGTERLGEVQGTPAKLAPLNQIPGELHVAAKNVERLRAELEK